MFDKESLLLKVINNHRLQECIKFEIKLRTGTLNCLVDGEEERRWGVRNKQMIETFRTF